ncbi:hypothetical protein O0L34_g10025 [Tuta absoluta]|nr:hypothetical protein O0L34_g10025 [Tuta absoluta]
MADKLIINELLTFVQNKIDVLDELSIAQICGSNFTDDEVEKGKAVLYNAFPASKVPLRRGEDKKKKDLKDIIKILKESDPIDLPTFVAKDLNRLPPVSFDHVDVTRLLKDINILKTDLQTMKADSVSKMELANLDMKISTELTGLKSTIQKADTQCKKKKTNNMNISTTPKRNDNRLTLMPTPACNVTGHLSQYTRRRTAILYENLGRSAGIRALPHPVRRVIIARPLRSSPLPGPQKITWLIIILPTTARTMIMANLLP